MARTQGLYQLAGFWNRARVRFLRRDTRGKNRPHQAARDYAFCGRPGGDFPGEQLSRRGRADPVRSRAAALRDAALAFVSHMGRDRATPAAALSDDAELLARLLGEPVSSVERVGRGRNSRVYRVCSRSGDYAAKFYFQKTADGRDRMQVEFDALSFLWGQGVRRIARPVRADAERQVAL